MIILFEEFALSILPVVILVLFILLTISWRRTHNRSYLFCCILFGIYAIIAIDQVLFPIPLNNSAPYSATNFQFGVNLVPFNFDFSFIPHIVMLQILQNILLTVPFGFGVHFIMNLTRKHFVWLTLIVGLGIEATQLGISLLLGYPYRIIDVNDVIMNTLGILIGYILFRSFGWFYIWVTQYFDIEHTGFTAYIYEVVHRPRMS